MFDKEKIDLIIKNNWNLKTGEIAVLLNKANLKTEHNRDWTQPHVSKYANKFLSLRKKAEHTRDHSKEENISEVVVGEIVAEEKEASLNIEQRLALIPSSIFENNGKFFTDSLMISKVFDIRHDNVLRDIRNLIQKDIELNLGLLKFEESIYLNAQQKEQPKYNMDKDTFLYLVNGYDSNEALIFRSAFVKKFRELENQVQQPKQILSDSERLLLQAQINVEHEKAIKQIDSNVSKVQEEVSSLRKTVETVIINFKPRRERNYNPNYKQASLFPTDENASKFDQIKSQVTQYSTLTNRSESSIYTMLYGIYDSEIFKRTGIRSNIKLEREKYNESQKSKNELSVIKYVDKFGDINLLHKITFNNIGFDNLGSASNG